MSINKICQNVKSQLVSKHSVTAMVSCSLLVVCSLLSTSAVSAQPASMADRAERHINKVTRLEHDPTRPPSMLVKQIALESASEPEYELTAIFTRNNHQYAVVNGNVVKAGDPVADMLVTEISASNLTMKHAGTSQKTSFKDILVLELSGTIDVKTQVKK